MASKRVQLDTPNGKATIEVNESQVAELKKLGFRISKSKSAKPAAKASTEKTGESEDGNL